MMMWIGDPVIPQKRDYEDGFGSEEFSRGKQITPSQVERSSLDSNGI